MNDRPWNLGSFLRWIRPTWRQGFLMLATFLLGSMALYTYLFIAKFREDAALVPTWFNLVAACRTSVEAHQPLFMFSLLPTGEEPDPLKIESVSRSSMWAPLGGGRFAVLETERDAQAGVLRSCEVTVADWRRPLSRLEIARLTLAFLEQRTQLLGAGQYEDYQIDPRANVASSGFRSKSLNPAGCAVATAMFADPLKGHFDVVTGEQPGPDCHGAASFIQPSSWIGTGAKGGLP